MSIKIDLNLYNGKSNNIRKAIDKTKTLVEFLNEFQELVLNSEKFHEAGSRTGPVPYHLVMLDRIKNGFGVEFTEKESAIVYDIVYSTDVVSEFNCFMEGYVNSFGRDGDGANLKIEDDDSLDAWMGFCYRIPAKTKAKMEKVLEVAKNNEA